MIGLDLDLDAGLVNMMNIPKDAVVDLQETAAGLVQSSATSDVVVLSDDLKVDADTGAVADN